jgi:hypothetical protein
MFEGSLFQHAHTPTKTRLAYSFTKYTRKTYLASWTALCPVASIAWAVTVNADGNSRIEKLTKEGFHLENQADPVKNDRIGFVMGSGVEEKKKETR